MANGDAAAAKGWTTVPSTVAHSTGYDSINYTLDKVAAELDARVAADALKFDAAKIVVSTTTPAVVTGGVWLRPLT